MFLALALQAAMLLDPGFLERDPEELFSAGQAWLALHGDLEWLLHMQYRPFCGGCTVHAVTAMGLFSVLPPTWLTWKLVPLAWGVLGLVAGLAVLRRDGLLAGSRMFALLWVFAPLTFAHLSLVAWGNHYEAGVLALVAAWVALGGSGPRRGLLLGALLGFSVYVSFSAGFALIACLGFVALRAGLRGLAPVLLGVPLGLSGWLLQWLVSAQHPFHTIYEESESMPDLGRVPEELWTLLAPRQLGALLGVPVEGAGLALGCLGAAGIAVAAGVAVSQRQASARLSAGLLGAFLGVYALTGFSVKVAETGFMYPGGLRYAAPLYPTAALLLSAVAGGLWSDGRRWRAVLLVLPWLMAGVWGRASVLASLEPAPERLGRDAVDWDYLRERLAWMVPVEGHEAGLSHADPHARGVHAYGLSRERLTARLRGADAGPLPSGCAAGLGAGDALVVQTPGWKLEQRLAVLDAQDLGAADRECAAERLAVDAIAQGRVLDTAEVGGPGVLRAAGAAWALRHAGARPGAVVLPAGAAAAFVEGVGLGLATAWGPGASQHPPDHLPAGGLESYEAGVSEGVSRHWSLGRGAVPDRAPASW